MRLLIGGLLAALLPATASAAPGDLDRSFGDRGMVTGRWGADAELIRALSGGATAVWWPDDVATPPVVAIDGAGTRSPLPGATGARAAGALGDGLVVVRRLPDGRWVTQRLGPSGDVDPTYAGDGEAELPVAPGFQPFHVLADRAGRVTVVGVVWEQDRHSSTLSIARLTPEGRPDPRFAVRTGALTAWPVTSVPAPHAGLWLSVNDYDAAVLHLDAAGRERSRTGYRGLRLPFRDRPMEAPALVRDRRGVLVAVNGSRAGHVVRLRRNGSPDPGFAPLRFRDAITGMARDRHGRLLVALGAIPPFGGERHAKLVRFTRAGRRDRTFGKGGTATVRARRWVGLALSSFQFDRHDRILAAGTAYDARYGEHDHSNYGRPHPLLVRLQG